MILVFRARDWQTNRHTYVSSASESCHPVYTVSHTRQHVDSYLFIDKLYLKQVS